MLRIDYWTYDADTHCAACATARFGGDALEQSGADGGPVDSEGNAPCPVYAIDEGRLEEQDGRARRAAVHCGTCGAECREVGEWQPDGSVPVIFQLTLAPGAEFFPAMFMTDMLNDLRDCGRSGDNSAAVDYFRAKWNPVGNNLSQHLAAYGAWEDAELADESANLDRAIWLLASDINECEAVGDSNWYIVLES